MNVLGECSAVDATAGGAMAAHSHPHTSSISSTTARLLRASQHLCFLFQGLSLITVDHFATSMASCKTGNLSLLGAALTENIQRLMGADVQMAQQHYPPVGRALSTGSRVSSMGLSACCL